MKGRNVKEVIGAQGEVVIIKIDAIPDGIETKKVNSTNNGYIVSHSESGHHHMITNGDVMERTSNVPTGMKILYAIVDKPAEFIHTALNQHGGYKLDPGVYEFRISREFDPFSEQARQVQD